MNASSRERARARRFLLASLVLVTLCAAGIVTGLITGTIANVEVGTSLFAGVVIGLAALAARRTPNPARMTR